MKIAQSRTPSIQSFEVLRAVLRGSEGIPGLSVRPLCPESLRTMLCLDSVRKEGVHAQFRGHRAGFHFSRGGPGLP